MSSTVEIYFTRIVLYEPHDLYNNEGFYVVNFCGEHTMVNREILNDFNNRYSDQIILDIDQGSIKKFTMMIESNMVNGIKDFIGMYEFWPDEE